jgi:hypothetical protein
MVTGSTRRGGGLDRLEIVFDDDRLVADAGLVLPALLASRLDAKRVLDEAITSGRDRLVGHPRKSAGPRAESIVRLVTSRAFARVLLGLSRGEQLRNPSERL